jgi:hypothetical protein
MWHSIASVVGGFLATGVLVGITTSIASRLLVGPAEPQLPGTVGAAYPTSTPAQPPRQVS